MKLQPELKFPLTVPGITIIMAMHHQDACSHYIVSFHSYSSPVVWKQRIEGSKWQTMDTETSALLEIAWRTGQEEKTIGEVTVLRSVSGLRSESVFIAVLYTSWSESAHCHSAYGTCLTSAC